LTTPPAIARPMPSLPINRNMTFHSFEIDFVDRFLPILFNNRAADIDLSSFFLNSNSTRKRKENH